MFNFPKPARKRLLDIRYTDPRFIKFYDLDRDDFRDLCILLSNGNVLTTEQNDRYGMHILTICRIVLDHVKFRNRSRSERDGLFEAMYTRLLQKLPRFTESQGRVFSFAYKAAYTAGLRWFRDTVAKKRREQTIQEHLDQCWEEYQSEVSPRKRCTQEF